MRTVSTLLDSSENGSMYKGVRPIKLASSDTPAQIGQPFDDLCLLGLVQQPPSAEIVPQSAITSERRFRRSDANVDVEEVLVPPGIDPLLEADHEQPDTRRSLLVAEVGVVCGASKERVLRRPKAVNELLRVHRGVGWNRTGADRRHGCD